MPTQFIIIGAPKCATTFLLKCLQEHPEVQIPRREVPLFLTNHYNEINVADFAREYLDCPGKKACGIKHANYLPLADCAPRIARHFPDIKLIVILRNPIDRAQSAWFQFVTFGFVPVLNLNKGMTKFLNGSFSESHIFAKDIINYGFYYRHLNHFLDYFKRESIHIILHEDIKNQPFNEFRKVCRFLAINDTAIPSSIGKKINKGPRSLTRARFYRIGSLFQAIFSEPDRKKWPPMHPDIHKELVGNNIVVMIFIKIIMLCPLSFWPFWLNIIRTMEPVLNQFVIRKERLNPALRKRLYEIYKEDIDNLEKLLGWDLSSWRG